ncbi:MAG: hypothetical protein KDE27_22920 [Planctomycetes bacterium]|nr:hypothetical protein [Planctomycetota bacterium]
MSRSAFAAALLFAPAVVFAQEGEAAAPDTGQQAKAAYEELDRAFASAIKEWREEALRQMAEAQKNKKPRPSIADNPPIPKFIERAQQSAMQYAGEDGAIPFHGFVLKYAQPQQAEAAKKAIVTLTLDHAASAAIDQVLPYIGAAAELGAKDAVLELCGEVIDANESATAKAAALIERGKLRLADAENDAERDAAKADLEQVGKVTNDEALVAKAEDALFELRHLQVGCEVADIVAKDVDGVEFKLSDYRGKAVLLDFWGFW